MHIWQTPSRGQARTSYVIFGHTSAARAFTDIDLLTFTSGSSSGFKILGAVAGDQSGGSVCKAGDVNGDGIGDVIVGAYLADPSSRADAGTAYVIFGHTNITASFTDIDLSTFTSGSSSGFKVFGPTAGDYLGWSVSTAGDVNGDGVKDIIIGADRADPSSRSYAGASS